MMFLAGCQDEGLFTPEEETSQAPVNVSFQVKLGGEEMSRAIGDASRVNQLIVGVFQSGTLLETYNFNKIQGQEKFTNVTIPMFKNQQYDLVFWAQVKDNGIYSIDNNFNINIDYSKYQDISLVGTESFEAFSAIRTGVTVDNPGNASIVLTRPFAQLNIAASEEEIFNKVNKTAFTINKVYTAYNPFSGAVGDPVEKRFSFTFSQSDVSDKQNTTINGKTYYYLASAYLLAPEEVVMIGGLYKDEEIYKALVFNELPLAANTRTNIYGNMVQQEVMQGWDGVTFTAPTNEGSTCNVTIEGATNILHIDTPEELAYCMQNGYPSGYDAIHICANIDMGGHDWDLLPVKTDNSRSANPIIPKNVPEGIVIVGTSGEGQAPFTISNAKVSSTGLFGDIKNVIVKNLKLKNIHVEASGNVGVLAGTVTGASIFENVIVEGGSVSSESSDIAGGMVGYINHESVTNQAVATTLSGCQANGITNITGSVTGKLVGEFSGYSYNEVLNFIDCSSDITMEATSFNNVNKSCFIEQSLENDENDLLGRETYCRGTVNFRGNRFVPKWDGRKVEPLTANFNLDGIESGKVIYSPADLAWFQEQNYTAMNVYLRSDLDMGGSGEDAQIFKPILTMKYLDGLKKDKTQFQSFDDCYKIHNLKVVKVHANGNGAAFILTGAASHTHQNLVFDSSCIISKHDDTITDINNSNYGNAYAGTIVCKVTGNYTVRNVLIQNGSVSGICKMGVLLGYCSGNLQATNCIVDQCTITNYDPQCINWYTQREDIESLNMVAYAKDSFFTDGEVGGLIGFITACSPTITNCSVINTTIDCTGEENKSVTIGVYNADRFNENNPGSPTIKGQVTIAGRHVNQFIGDIRTQNTTDVITINNPYVENNRYLRDGDEHLISETETKTKTEEWSEGSGWSKKNYRTYDCNNTKTYSTIVGCAYVVAVTLKVNLIIINIDKHVGDYKGVININNSNITEQSTRTTEVKTGTEASWTKYNCTYNWTYETFKNPVGETAIDRFIGDDFSM